MAESSIQRILNRNRPSNVAYWMNNFTPKGWWECDLCWINKNGYTVENEIKLSVSDFRADFKKRRFKSVRIGKKRIQVQKFKHSYLENGDQIGPNRFYFVSPLPELEKLIPSWAGFKLVTGKKVKTVKQAPLLHRHKNANWIDQMIRIGYYRYAYSRR